MTNTKIIVGGHEITTNKVGSVHSITLPSDVSGQAYYVVTNGICHLYVTGLNFSGLNGKTITNVVPKAKLTAHGWFYQHNQLWVSSNSTDLCIYKLADIAIHGSMDYPVADDWVEN